eukprot:scaffold102809_cov54-Attheya_sp.AAC.3
MMRNEIGSITVYRNHRARNIQYRSEKDKDSSIVPIQKRMNYRGERQQRWRRINGKKYTITTTTTTTMDRLLTTTI